ncbi:MAG TPA: DUF4064 domain-containing protein [Thermoplasmatales archaeon]|nr:DUF4064 domain-containing protein [Thermoplasmatales archaeon]
METTAPYENSISDSALYQTPEQKKQSTLPLIAGIFLLIAGLLGLFTWSSALALDSSMIESVLPADAPVTVEQLQSLLTICGIIGCILSVFTLAGGIVALKRKAWGLAVVGGILGLFTIGPFLVASIIALIGLLLVIVSRKDFQ